MQGQPPSHSGASGNRLKVSQPLPLPERQKATPPNRTNTLWQSLIAHCQNIGAAGGGISPPPWPWRSRERLVLAAFVCLLVLSAGLRFYDMSGKSLWHDEAIAANNSGGALSEVVPNTRYNNSSPILYPLALWAVQKVNVSVFSIRVLPATASVLTVAVMLFLLPRLGVARWAAFLAALLATLSVQAIRHAQDAREYSIDALLAALMIAGLLWYLRDGRKALLCVALFLAPLLQYGLVLFGVAVIAAAVVLSPATLSAPEWNAYLSRIRNWLKSRIALLLPTACFLAGCAISYAVTVRYQLENERFGLAGYLSAYYYQGNFDARAIFEFSIDRIWDSLTYHLPEFVAIAALAAFALLLVASFLRRLHGEFPGSAIAVLFLLCIAVSVTAAVLRIYPFGHTRQSIYLGPVIFLGAGVFIYWMIDSLSALARRAWLAPALAIAVAGAIALAGVGDIRKYSSYKAYLNINSILAVLKEPGWEEDMVYFYGRAVPIMQFYQGKEGRPANYYYGTSPCSDSFEPCLREMANSLVSLPAVPNRIFFVHDRKEALAKLELLGEQILAEPVITDGDFALFLITNAKKLKESVEAVERSAYEALVSGEPVIRADFDIYIGDNTLTYAKEPCDRADTEAIFFLHLVPADVADLPDDRKRHGFDNRDFSFDGHGVILDGKCVVRIPLPEYDIAAIRTGQYVQVDGGFDNLWEEEIRLER